MNQSNNDAVGIDYLDELSKLSKHEQFPQVKKWMKSEPLPFFKQLREQKPVLVTEECTLVSLFVDVRDVLQMPKIFTVDLYKPKMGVTDTDPGYLMAHDDNALHYREKSLMQGMLNRDDLPRIRELIAKASKDILDKADGEIEVVNEFCRMVPAVLVEDYFGLDGVDKKDLIEWSFWNQYDVFHNQPFDLNSAKLAQHITTEHDRVSKQLVAYIAKLMARKLVLVKAEKAKNLLLTGWYLLKRLFMRLTGQKTEQLKDDIVSRMLRTHYAKEVDFSLIRVGVNAGGLLIGAIETTSQAVAQSIKYFLDNPEIYQKAKLAAINNDEKEFDAMVWESLRFVPISPYMFRQASEDYVIAKNTDRETLIKKGTNVLLLTQSAMFDNYSYDNPEVFDADRNWYHNFNFGFGSHDCLGKYVGMVMIPEMIKQVLLRDQISPISEMDYKNGPFPEDYKLAWR